MEIEGRGKKMKKNKTQKWNALLLDSTPISKCFARQGIKIPIRKEKVNKHHITHNKSNRKSSLTTIDLSEDDTEDDDP